MRAGASLAGAGGGLFKLGNRLVEALSGDGEGGGELGLALGKSQRDECLFET